MISTTVIKITYDHSMACKMGLQVRWRAADQGSWDPCAEKGGGNFGAWHHEIRILKREVMAEASSMWEGAINLGAGAAVLDLLKQCYPDDGVVLETWSG